MLTVVCVLKSGGDFDQDYVYALQDGVEKHLTIPHKFVCYTDTPIKDMPIRLLSEDLPGWFSKFEVFKEIGPALYLDLDTVVTGEIDSLGRDIEEAGEAFWMLEAFSPLRVWASGIMAWTGDWNWLVTHCRRYAGLYPTDQECIAKALKDDGTTPRLIRRSYYHIYSYKHHCLEGLPNGANIVCFHGKPRPRDVREDWNPWPLRSSGKQ